MDPAGPEFLDRGSEPEPLQRESSVPTTGPPGESQHSSELTQSLKNISPVSRSGCWGWGGGKLSVSPPPSCLFSPWELAIPVELVPRRSGNWRVLRTMVWGPRALGGFLWTTSSHVLKSHVYFLLEYFGVICFSY